MKKIYIALLAAGLFYVQAQAAESTTSTQAPESIKIEKTDLSKAKVEPAKDKAQMSKNHKNKHHMKLKKAEAKTEEKK